jgi:hypothetical protein
MISLMPPKPTASSQYRSRRHRRVRAVWTRVRTEKRTRKEIPAGSEGM